MVLYQVVPKIMFEPPDTLARIPGWAMIASNIVNTSNPETPLFSAVGVGLSQNDGPAVVIFSTPTEEDAKSFYLGVLLDDTGDAPYSFYPNGSDLFAM